MEELRYNPAGKATVEERERIKTDGEKGSGLPAGKVINRHAGNGLPAKSSSLPAGNVSRTLLVPGLLILAALFFILDVSIGTIHIPVRELIRIVFNQHSDNEAWVYIIHKIRIPKAFTAVLVGCGLSVCGLQMQTLFRNPLADPSILGVSSGASLGVALVMFYAGSITSLAAIQELGITGSWLVILAGALGSALVMLVVIFISSKLKDNIVVLVIGVMIATIVTSVISIWQYFSAPELIKEFLMWTFGSLGGVTGSHLLVLAMVVMIGLLISFASSKYLNVLLLGENYARSMGLTVRRARLLIICSTSILAGGITAFCGPISFIGLAVPPLTRALFRTSDHKLLIPGCCLTGTTIMLACDVISQLTGSETALPINIITGLVGAPLVVWIIISRNKVRVL